MGPLLWSAAYLAAHLMLYVLVLRHVLAFGSERVIFLYHFVSAVLVSGSALAGLLIPAVGVTLETAAAIVALHGVYSISFLELWSLAEGGYSIQILEHLRAAERTGTPPDLDALRAIGTSKQANRLDGISRLGLAHTRDGQVALTGAGRAVAGFLAAVAWLVAVRDGL